MTVNIERYLARPWVSDSYNCFDLVREFYRVELGLVIPESGVSASDLKVVTEAFANHPLRHSFAVIAEPENFCVIGMRLSYSKNESHCGIYLKLPDGEFVLHNWCGSGVLLEQLSRLPWRGLAITGFYTYI